MPKSTVVPVLVLAAAIFGSGTRTALTERNAAQPVESSIDADALASIPFELRVAPQLGDAEPAVPAETLRSAKRNPFTLLRLLRDEDGKLSFAADERAPDPQD